jgi:hypothetical protein
MTMCCFINDGENKEEYEEEDEDENEEGAE